MSSNYRDVGEVLGSIAKRIPVNVDGLSMEEMKSLLRTIKGDAEDEYGTYANFMGWSDSKEEAIANLYDNGEDDTQDNSPVKISLFVVSDWLAKQRCIPTIFEAIVNFETDKAWNTSFGWVPKSQLTSKLDAEWSEYPPHECVPWFEERIAVGDYVRFRVDGGLGGQSFVDGMIEKIDSPELYVNGRGYMMGNISYMVKFVKQGDEVVEGEDEGFVPENLTS